jgi:hypothetical protein
MFQRMGRDGGWLKRPYLPLEEEAFDQCESLISELVEHFSEGETFPKVSTPYTGGCKGSSAAC